MNPSRPDEDDDDYLPDRDPEMPPEPPPIEPAPDPCRMTLAELEALYGRAAEGDQTALAACQSFLARDGSAVWREIGNLADVAQKTLSNTLFAGRKAAALSARRRFEHLRRELASDHATPLEQLAIDRVILASMFADALDVVAAAEGARNLVREKLLRAQLLAERRMQAALKSLELARTISRTPVAKPLTCFTPRGDSSNPSANPRSAAG